MSWDAVVLYVVLGAIVTAGGWTRLEAIPAGLAAVLVVVTLISAPKMRVTRQTIVVGHQSFKVGEVRFCRVKRVSRDTGRSRSTTTYLQFEFDAERVESVRVPTIPGGFYAAMNALGLPPISV